MQKIIITLLTAIIAITAHTQLPSSFPPKPYPASILVVTDPSVAKYWDVKRMMYLGPGNGDHKFRLYGYTRIRDELFPTQEESNDRPEKSSRRSSDTKKAISIYN